MGRIFTVVCSSCLASLAIGAEGMAVNNLRLSVGVARGFDIPQEELDKTTNSLMEEFDIAVGAYETNAATTLEVPMLFELPAQGRFRFLAGPAAFYSRNTNDIHLFATDLLGPDSLTANGSDTITVVGLKLYGGGRYMVQDQFALEFLPYLGYGRTRVQSEGSIRGELGGISIDENMRETYSGNALLYGATMGAYYLSPSGFQIGSRLGYAGGTSTVDDVKYTQNGASLSLDVGWGW